jgi:integrase/recombinase XerC
MNYFKQQLEHYLNFLFKIRGYSINTIKTYELNLDEALRYISIEKDTDRYDVDLIPYRIKLVGKNRKTIYKKISIFKSFVAYLRDNGDQIVVKNDEFIKISKTLPKPISKTYIFEAIKLCSSDDRLLVLMLYSLGLRISELANLKIKDIKFGWVRINGKGDKIREIPVLKNIEKELERYMDKFNPTLYLFEKNRQKMNENQLRYKLTKIFKKIGIKTTPHQLRHSFASDLLENGARIVDVSSYLVIHH